MSAYVTAEHNGRKMIFDFESITAREYKVIKRHTGLKLGEFQQAFLDASNSGGLDIEVIDCLLWLFLKRCGMNIDPETLDDYNPVEFMSSFDVVRDAKPATEEAPLVEASTPTEI